MYFKDGKSFYVAFNDEAKPERNILLSRADEGFNALLKKGHWLLPKDDPDIQTTLFEAQRQERIFEVREKTRTFSTKSLNGVSTVENDEIAQAIFGDVAKPFVEYLGKAQPHPFPQLNITLLNIADVKDQKIDLCQTVQVLSVSMSRPAFTYIAGFNCDYDVFADSRISFAPSRVRGVANTRSFKK